MSPSLLKSLSPFTLAALAGASSHLLVFKYREPKVVHFLVGNSALTIAAFTYFLSERGNAGLSDICAAGFAAFATQASFLAGLTLSVIAYRLSPWHPLASYDGPLLARVTKWYMSYWIAKGHRHLALQRWHEKYGPWIRIGPNELSVSDPSAIRPIYSTMFRAPFYAGAPVEADALITTIIRSEHAARVQAWNKAFSDGTKKFGPFAQNRTTQLLDIMRDERKANVSNTDGKGFSLSHWISLWAMDIMGDMSFSGGFETLAAGKDSEGWMEVLSIGVLAVGILGQVPWMRDIIALLPQPGPIVTFQKFANKKVGNIRKNSAGVPSDILSMIQDDTSAYHLSDKEAAADASFLVVAGWDTVSHASTTFFRYVIGDNAVFSRLRKELDDAFDGPVEDMDAFTLGKLPYLDACVQEALRIVPPVAAGPPRYSGKTVGQVLDKFIPPGTTIACPIFTMHHDPGNFADPEVFRPERWLGTVKGAHNTDAFVPFSAGIGICIGKQVALHNMKLLAASVIRTMDLNFAPGFNPSEFDKSYKEHNLWLHDPLMVQVAKRNSA